MSDCSEVCEALRGALHELPLFPLGSTVLFPNTLLPLNIFEPRYRQMTEHALASHKMIAVVQCDRAGEVAAVAGVGRIVHHERLPDGRFHLLLQGIARVQIEEELERGEFLFRRARTSLIRSASTVPVERALMSLRACYDQLRLSAPTAEDNLGEIIGKMEDPAVIADVVCAAALGDPAARQRALAEPCVATRLEMATDGLADLLLTHAPKADVVH